MPTPLSRVHAPCLAAPVGAGAGRAWGSCPQPLPHPILGHGPQGTAQAGTEGEAQGYLWEDFPRQLEFPPHPKWRPGQGTCAYAGAGGGLPRLSLAAPPRGPRRCL